MAFLRGMGEVEEEKGGGEEWMVVREGDLVFVMPSESDIFSYPGLGIIYSFLFYSFLFNLI